MLGSAGPQPVEINNMRDPWGVTMSQGIELLLIQFASAISASFQRVVPVGRVGLEVPKAASSSLEVPSPSPKFGALQYGEGATTQCFSPDGSTAPRGSLDAYT